MENQSCDVQSIARSTVSVLLKEKKKGIYSPFHPKIKQCTTLWTQAQAGQFQDPLYHKKNKVVCFWIIAVLVVNKQG